MLLQGEAVAVEKCFATWQFLANFQTLFFAAWWKLVMAEYNNNMHLAILTWSPTWHCINLLLNSSAVQFQNPQPPLSPNTPRGTWLSGPSMPRRALLIHCILSEGSTLPRQTGKIC